jgi:large subunit ribosomal protein L17
MPDQRKALVRSLARELFIRGQIMTTVTRARQASKLVEKIITLAKKGDLSSHRRAIELLPDAKVLAPVFKDAGERFADRSSGYTRVTRANLRRGDAAQTALLEIIS